MLLKNGWVTALDVGGRLLAPGETGDLDEAAPAVAEHLSADRLVRVAIPPAAPKAAASTSPSKPATREN